MIEMDMETSEERVLRHWHEYTGGEASTVSVQGKRINPADVRPLVYGHHTSFVVNGVRRWRFEDRVGYFKFVNKYRDYLVE